MAHTVDRDWHGHVELAVPGEVHVEDMDLLTWESWTRTVACPRCRKDSGLVLHAHDDKGLVFCPDDELAFHDRLIDAASVRQLFALHSASGVPADQPLTVPALGGLRVWLRIVPVLEEDQAVQAPSEDDNPMRDWTLNFGLSGRDHWTPFTSAMHWARKLLTWSLPCDGEIFQQVYGTGTARPDLEAHMVMVALGLAVHEAAFRAGLRADLWDLPLTAPMNLLKPGEAGERQRLRALRPSRSSRVGGTLRLTDVARIEGSTAAQWDRWCDGACRILEGHLRDARVSDAQRHGRMITLPRTARLAERHNCFNVSPDDFTWYADGEAAAPGVTESIPEPA